MDTHEDHPLAFQNQQDADAIREVLNKAEFTDKGVVELIGGQGAGSIIGTDMSQHLHHTRGDTPLEVLVRLFLIGVPVEVETARRAFEPTSLEMWVDTGLVIRHDGKVNGAVNLLPFQGLLLAYDTKQTLQSARTDFVMGVGKSSMTLANLTVRRPFRQALDLGAGGGIQAFFAAKHCQRVFAVDRNERAVKFAAFNAQLCGLSNVVCRAGDLFEPVEGETFDLIVSNPPFVISPESQYIYRDSGYKGDEVCQKIIREVPKFLEENGWCIMLCNWAHLEGQDWRQRLAGWFKGTGCDALVLRSETSGPEVYASTWIKHTELNDTQHYDQRLDQWLNYYKKQQIEAVSAGVLLLNRVTSRPNWFETQDTPKGMLGPCGEEVVGRFQAKEFLNAVSDDRELLDATLVISPNARLIQHCQPTAEGVWAAAALELTKTEGFVFRDKIDAPMANLLSRCTGLQPLRPLVKELAAAVGREFDFVCGHVLPLLRQMVQRGYLKPKQSDSTASAGSVQDHDHT